LQDCKDESELQLVKFGSVTAFPEIKIAILMELEFLSRYFVSQVYIPSPSPLLSIFCLFQDIKQANSKFKTLVKS